MTHLDPRTSAHEPLDPPTSTGPSTVWERIAFRLIGGAATALVVISMAWVCGWLLANFPQI